MLFDGNPGHPDLGALWKLAERHGVTVFGVSAPYVQSCLKAGLKPGEAYDLSTIRAIGSTGRAAVRRRLPVDRRGGG